MVVAIADCVRSVRPGPPQGPELRVLPILGSSNDFPPYRLLDQESLASVVVTEISDAGSVPELVVQNKLDVRVFLMDGQELVGAKQNRILNTDVLVPAMATLKIPVSCVEQGRWRHTSNSFSPGKTASYSTRARKPERVKDALRRSGRHDADQGAVWNEVEASLAKCRVTSPTMALSDGYAARNAELATFRESLQLPDDAVGLAIFHGTSFRGLDIFDRHSTLKYFWESLVDSYAIEWLGVKPEAQAVEGELEQKMVREILDRTASGAWESFASPGEGRDWRLEDPDFTGSGLICDDKSVLHLQLFPKGRAGDAADEQRRRPRIHRPYVR